MNDLNLWRENTQKMYKIYNQKIIENNVARDKFHGFKVWYSPIILNPKILLIGINPGIGEQTPDKNINFNESLEFEYLPQIPKYTLANEMKSVFRSAGLFRLLEEQTVKTNYYHIISKRQSDIKFGLESIDKSLFLQYEKDTKEIMIELIAIINPKYIVCEGATIYHKVINLFEDRQKSVWQNDVGVTKINEPDIKVFGCSRRLSRIRNKKAFADVLKENIEW